MVDVVCRSSPQGSYDARGKQERSTQIIATWPRKPSLIPPRNHARCEGDGALTVEASFYVYGVPSLKVNQMSRSFLIHAQHAKSLTRCQAMSQMPQKPLACRVRPCRSYKRDHRDRKDNRCDVIVIGSHARSGVAAIVLESVTAKVLTYAVLVCRPFLP